MTNDDDRTGVLVVEPDEDLRAALRTTLEARGYRVHAAATREEGYDLMDAMAPEVLLLNDFVGAARSYRLLWLNDELPETRLELSDLAPGVIETQLQDLFDSGNEAA